RARVGGFTGKTDAVLAHSDYRRTINADQRNLAIRKIRGIVRVAARVDLVLVTDPIAVAVRIGVVANAVAVQVPALVCIVREGILLVGHAVTVAVGIQAVGNTVAILIRRHTAGIVGVGA